jgi:hypothetical protein
MAVASKSKLTASPAARAAVAVRAGVMASPGRRQPAAASVRQAPEQQQEKFRQMRARQREFTKLLQDHWPVAFCDPPVPLAIGIHHQLRKALGTSRHYSAIATALGWWTNRSDYLAAVARGEPRRGLDGTVAGEVSEIARELARRELVSRTFHIVGSAAVALLYPDLPATLPSPSPVTE